MYHGTRTRWSLGSGPHFTNWSMPALERDLTRKLHELLSSPLRDGVARILEDSYRMLPIGQGQKSD